MSDGSSPPADAEVSAVTGRREIDHPETIAFLGGTAAYERLVREGGLKERVRKLGGWKPGYATRATGEGTFELSLPRDFPDFRFEVESDFATYARERRYSLDSAEISRGVTLTLDPAARVEGTLSGPEGRPVAGGRVVLSEIVTAPFAFPRSDREADADGSGHFVFRGVAPGDWNLVALGEGAALAKTPITAVAREIVRADLVLPAEGVVVGRVVDEAGRGIPAAGVAAVPGPLTAELGLLEYGAGRTDESGGFRIGSLRAGPHRLRAVKDGFLQKEDPDSVVVTAGTEATATVVLVEGHHAGGRVVGASGGPVPGAVVDASADWRSARGAAGIGRRAFFRQRTETGSDGSFRLTGLGEGPYELLVEKAEVATVLLRNVPTDADDLLVSLPGPTGLAGAVFDAASGAPMRRYRLSLERIERSENSVGRSSDAQRDVFAQDGAFRLLGLRPAEYNVRARADGYVEGTIEGVAVEAGKVRDGLELRLDRAATLRGRVVADGSSEPVAGAQVETDREGMFGHPSSVQTGPDGSFELTGLGAGTVRLKVSHVRFMPRQVDPIDLGRGQSVEGVLVTLRRGGGVEGRALGEGGKPLVGAVFASPSEGWGQKNAGIDEEGRFRLEGMEPGAWTVSLQVERTIDVGIYQAEEVDSATVRIEEGRMARLDFTPSEGTCRLRGRVTRGGDPVAGARVSVSSEASEGKPGQPSKSAETGKDGAFEIERIRAGEAKVRVQAPCGEGWTFGQVSLEVEATIPEAPEHFLEIRLPSGGISGRVARLPEGTPIVSALVVVESVAASERGWDAGSAETNGEGRFRVIGLPSGAYRVTARPPYGEEYAPRTEERVEVVDGVVSPVDLALEEEGRALVEVVDERGDPVREAWVGLRTLAEGEGVGVATSWAADAAGIARVRRIAPGLYYAAADSHGTTVGFSEEAPVRSGQETRFRIRMVEGIEARVRVRDAEGRPVTEAGVDFLDEKGRRTRIWWQDPEGAKPGERAAVARLAPGDYRLRVSAGGFRRSEQTVRVEGTSPVEVVVRLERETPPK
jgi:hypothetical protein